MMFPVKCEPRQFLLENLVSSEHRRFWCLEQALDEIARNVMGEHRVRQS